MRALLIALAAVILLPTPALAVPALVAPAATDPPLPRLHATHGADARVVDQRGAQVLLRGVNVNQLGDYFQANPALEPTIELTRADFRDIAALGFNSVRLVVSWSALEPTPGAYDTDYVDRIREAIGWAAAYDLYVVLDMHQDAYGIAVDTPAGTTCPRGTRPGNGWDGAPAWATITDGASTCTPGERELAQAVIHAWQNFYDDTAGVQTHLVETWGRLARSFARNRTVAGFDLLNEPGFGLDVQANLTTDLGDFYRRAIAAIRAGERARDGFSHIVFWEPNVLWSAGLSRTVPAPGFTSDRNLVFAPHIYSESLSGEPIASGFGWAARVAARHDVAFWSGEWGFFPARPADAADQIERYAGEEDDHAVGGAWWSWKQACGDPHVVHEPGGEPDAVSPSLNRYSCPDQVMSAPDPAFADVLSRPAPRAVPGRITALRSDGRTGAFDLRGRRTAEDRACALRVFVPARFAGLRVRTEGVRRLQRERHQGNLILRGCVAETFRVRLG